MTVDRRSWPTHPDERFRTAFVKHHAAMHAVEVHETPREPGLTPYGIATCAASAAIVLSDPDHWNHERVMRDAMARAEREAGS